MPIIADPDWGLQSEFRFSLIAYYASEEILKNVSGRMVKVLWHNKLDIR
jgi:hypothetical protein